MLTSLGLIFLLGLLMAAVCQRIHLPRIIGMLLTGIILGPYVLDLLDVSILNISSELRQIALIIILLKAGLSLDLKDLKKVGRSAVMLACVPATCELLAFVIFAPMILNISRVDAAVMGAVLAAVSPAVVVPRMVHLMESGYGTEKSIPQMILAGASCDDIYVIVLFSTFVGMAQGGQVNALDFVNIPVSILTGVLFGALVGWLLGQLFELLYRKGSYVRNSMKVIIIMGLSFLLMALETLLKGTVAFSGLLAVVSMACALKIRAPREVTGRLSAKFGKLWLAAEVVLFVLVGAAVDIRYTMEAGLTAIGMILLALIFRSIGVTLCLLGTNLNKKERSVLHDRLFTEGYGAGRHRFRAPGHGIALWQDRSVRGGAGDPDYGTLWEHWEWMPHTGSCFRKMEKIISFDSHPARDRVPEGSRKNVHNIYTIRTAGTLSLWRRT